MYFLLTNILDKTGFRLYTVSKLDWFEFVFELNFMHFIFVFDISYF